MLKRETSGTGHQPIGRNISIRGTSPAGTLRSILLGALVLLVCAASAGYAQRLVVTPSTLTFPCTVEGERSTMTIELENRGPVRLHVRDFRLPPGSPFSASRRELRIEPGESETVTITFAPRNAPGTWREEMIVQAAANRETVTLVGTSSVPPTLVSRPTVLEFQGVPGLDTAEQCVLLENPSCKPLSVTDLDLDGQGLRLLNPPDLPKVLSAGERLQLCVELLPGPPGEINGRLRVETNLGGNRTLTIPIQGRRNGPGVITVPLRGIDFGRVPVNVISRELKIGIVNRGPAPITIRDTWELVGPDSGEFIVYPPPLPAQLEGNGDDTVWFGVRFAPSTAEKKLAGLRFGPRQPDELVAPIQGVGIREGLAGSPLNIDMGELLAGRSRTAPDTIILRNDGTAPVPIRSIEMEGDTPGAFRADGPPPGDLQPGESISYSLTFSPDATGTYAATLTFHLGDGSLLPVRIRGAGVASERYRFWIDSAAADVNQRFDLHVRNTPDIGQAEGITGYTVRLRFSPAALYLHGATAADGGENRIERIGSDTVVLTYQSGTPISGPVLATLSFEGLVTGRQENIVELIDVQLGGDTSNRSIWRNGLVILRGCDIGFGIGYGRPVVARAAWPSPAGEQVTVRYIAPADSRPSLTIVDLTGREYDGPPMPAGTGEEQETTVNLGNLEPGFYILQLRSGSGRSSVPVVIDR